MIWEVFQGLGAAVGLVTGAFVFYEHVMRHVPLAYIIATPLMGTGSRFAYLRIDNRSPRPILISWPSGTTAGTFSIGKDHSTRSIVEGLIDGQRAIAIDGNTSRDLVLMKPPDFEHMSPETEAEIMLQWRYAQPLWWKPDRTIRVRIAKRDLLLLLDEAEEPEGE